MSDGFEVDPPWDTPWPPDAGADLEWDPLTLAEIKRLEVPTLSWVVDGLFPAGSLTLFTGREKEGKSLAVLDAAASVAAGEAWAGRATTAGPVIYCPAEDSIRTVRDRLSMRIGTDLDDDQRPLMVHPLSGVAVRSGREAARLDLNDAALVARLWAMVTRHRPVLLVLDCLRELHGARENESDDMTVTMRPLRQLAHELNVAVVVVHHASKGASGSSRGSTAIAAACDAVAGWTAIGDQSATPPDGATGGGFPSAPPPEPAPGDPLRATLTVRGRDVPRTAIRLELGEDLRFRPIPAGEGTTAVPLATARERILTELAGGKWLTATEIAAAAWLPDRTVSNNLAQLIEQPETPIERTGSGLRGDPFRFRATTGRATAPAVPSAHFRSLIPPEYEPWGATESDSAPDDDLDARAEWWRS